MNNVIERVLGTVAMVPKGEYSSEAYYEKLNTVLYNDSTYMAIKPSTGVLPTDTEYWQLIGGGVTKEYLEETVEESILENIEDSLESDDETKSLSAKQGKILNEEKIEINKNIIDTNTINKKFKNVNISNKYYNGNLYYLVHLKNISELKVLPTSGDISNPITNAKNLLEFSKLSDYDVLINASPFANSYEPLGYQKSNNSSYTPSGGNENPSYLYYACFDDLNNLTIKKANTISSINDLSNYKNVCTGFQSLYIDGSQVTTTNTDKARRQVIAQLNDLSYLIITTCGRSYLNHGSSYQDLKDILSLYDVKNAISLDGGGSTQTFIFKNSVTTPSDLAEIDGRIVPISLGFKVGEIND